MPDSAADPALVRDARSVPESPGVPMADGAISAAPGAESAGLAPTPAGLAALFTTVVSDNGLPPAQATNYFTVFVAPFPAITNVAVTSSNVILSWLAPSNDQFEVQWTTNLASPITWNLLPGTNTSTSDVFSYTDTNTPVTMKFYELILLP